MSERKEHNIMISGGGTGGHVYPAIAIADAIRDLTPDAKILFVGAKGKIEMEKVPQAGYSIKGLWISGFHRKHMLRNVSFPFKLLSSLWKSWSILRAFRPHVVVGVGGFASGPILAVAARMGLPTLIQEQNSFPGVTNKLLAKQVDKICVAYSRMERFFPEDKIISTGNPVRTAFLTKSIDKKVAFDHFGLDPERKTIFVFGGSLGAASINRAIAAGTDLLEDHDDVQLLWQVGKLYVDQYRESTMALRSNVKLVPFVDRMDYAFAIADITVCRAGAGTISELCLTGQAAILIPSPNVAEDHQTKNAMALVAQEAALMVKDSEVGEKALKQALEALEDQSLLDRLSMNAKELAKPEAARTIALEVLDLIK